MAVSALVNATRNPRRAATYRSVIGEAPIVVSFMTVTELRYGALRAGWGELRRRGLERDLAQFVIVQPDDPLKRVCAELRRAAPDLRTTRPGPGAQDPRSGPVDRSDSVAPGRRPRLRGCGLSRRARPDRPRARVRLNEGGSDGPIPAYRQRRH